MQNDGEITMQSKQIEKRQLQPLQVRSFLLFSLGFPMVEFLVSSITRSEKRGWGSSEPGIYSMALADWPQGSGQANFTINAKRNYFVPLCDCIGSEQYT